MGRCARSEDKQEIQMATKKPKQAENEASRAKAYEAARIEYELARERRNGHRDEAYRFANRARSAAAAAVVLLQGGASTDAMLLNNAHELLSQAQEDLEKAQSQQMLMASVHVPRDPRLAASPEPEIDDDDVPF